MPTPLPAESRKLHSGCPHCMSAELCLSWLPLSPVIRHESVAPASNAPSNFIISGFIQNIRNASRLQNDFVFPTCVEKKSMGLLVIPLKRDKYTTMASEGGLQKHIGRRLDSFHEESSRRCPPRQWCAIL